MDSWLIAYLVLSGAALLLSVLLTVQTWEHRRYARSCMRGRDRHWPTGRAAVLVPCKGVDVDLDGNLAALFRQDYRDFELVFVVEDRDDPACAVIDRLIAGHPNVRARRIVAGRSSQSGQKVHNLRAGVAALGPDVQYLAFVDSDAAPRREWLRLLLARLSRPEIGATTGYRWFIPARPSLANYLLYSMNCGVMMLLGLRGQHWVWGGSWAITPQTLRRDRPGRRLGRHRQRRPDGQPPVGRRAAHHALRAGRRGRLAVGPVLRADVRLPPPAIPARAAPRRLLVGHRPGRMHRDESGVAGQRGGDRLVAGGRWLAAVDSRWARPPSCTRSASSAARCGSRW